MGAGASSRPSEAVTKLSGDELNKALSDMPDLKLELNGSAYKFVSARPLELERAGIYAAQFPDCVGAEKVMAVVAEGDAGKKEFTAVVKGSSVSLVKGECAITLAELLPSEAIEYSFSEAPDKWAVAKLSQAALEEYRKTKFGQWKDLLLKGECEAQLRRMLQAGVVSAMYDDVVFPTPDEYKHLFKVKCEKTGRMVNIPHPVAALRVWNASDSKYDTLDPALEGAPSDADKESWWAELLTSLKAERGEEYIDGLLSTGAAEDEEPPAAIADLKFELDGKAFKFLEMKPLDLGRAGTYKSAFPACVGAEKMVAVLAEGDDGKKEFTVIAKGDSVSVVKGECAISCCELLPSEAVEYNFMEDPDTWYVALICRDALEAYRKIKFGQWKDLLLKGDCEAQLRRMLQAGVVSAMYDDVVFPTPAEYGHLFKVKCEKTGRMVNIPHPVAGLRIWNTSESKYDALDTLLEGAPSEADKDAWWTEFLGSLKETKGADYIEGLLASDDAGHEEAATVEALKLELNGVAFKFVSEQPLSPERVAIYAPFFPEVGVSEAVVSIIAENDSGKKEFIAVGNKGSFHLVKGECSITLADLLPSEAIEFCFAEAPDTWALALISQEALEMYRKMKFGQWKDMLLKGECEAQLRRMLQAGPVTAMYDDVVFPTPEEYKHLFKVKCEKTGRMVNIPHPVAGLRVWSASESTYVALDIQLEGSPAEADKDAWWTEMLTTLREERGAEYIDGLLSHAPGVDDE